MAVETLSFVYTSITEIEKIYSSAGADFASDDFTGADLTQLQLEIVEDATDYINQYVLGRYRATDLADSRWVRTRASWIGAYFLSQRRGNPAPEPFFSRKEEIEEELIKVRDQKIMIPRLSNKSDFTPALSNYKIDHRFRKAKIRVQQRTSTGGTSSRQDLDRDIDNELL